jgi:hypothetical protein
MKGLVILKLGLVPKTDSGELMRELLKQEHLICGALYK